MRFVSYSFTRKLQEGLKLNFGSIRKFVAVSQEGFGIFRNCAAVQRPLFGGF
ncbi:hypothetical protein [Chryseobacterium indoltheticum]|uniref:hypothetical protein n=1 Tax=Chryseobacterium indoltheticum TaxID=254 RepID=UPI0013563859|nr:hypothetical protein [Chryseobacterium indoltheticum]